ncbi:hypothetical protein SpCBS45565_g00852 [Spizellomyces sp. 'palustris']|nr:hypothetical protein SpCBS45565_g00852 [Spizellomyces sp. 'palustris']
MAMLLAQRSVGLSEGWQQDTEQLDFVDDEGTVDDSETDSVLAINDDDVDQLSEEELRRKLKESLAVLREKERDLTIAAEVGQHLLEAHAALREAYDNYLTDTSRKSVTRPPTLSRSNSTPSGLNSRVPSFDVLTANTKRQKINDFVKSCENLFASSDVLFASQKLKPRRQRQNDWGPSMDYLAGSSSLAKSMELLSGLKNSLRKDPSLRSVGSQGNGSGADLSGYVSTLEKQAQEYQTQIANLTAELKDLTIARTKEAERYALHMDETRAELGKANDKVESLLLTNRDLRRQIRDNSKEHTSLELEDQALIDTLTKKLRETEEAYQKLLQEKQNADNNLDEIASEARRLQTLVNQLERQVGDQADIKTVCEHQQTLINELQEQLEEVRGTYTVERAEWEGSTQPRGIGSQPQEQVIQQKSLHDILSSVPKPLPTMTTEPIAPSARRVSATAAAVGVLMRSEPTPQRRVHHPSIADVAQPNSSALLFNLMWGYVRGVMGRRGEEEEAVWNAVVGGSGVFGCI